MVAPRILAEAQASSQRFAAMASGPSVLDPALPLARFHM